jgi:hypothetical protein
MALIWVYLGWTICRVISLLGVECGKLKATILSHVTQCTVSGWLPDLLKKKPAYYVYEDPWLRRRLT